MENRSIFKGNNSLPLDFLKVDTFQKGLCVQESEQEVTKDVSLVRHGNHLIIQAIHSVEYDNKQCMPVSDRVDAKVDLSLRC